MELLIPAFGVFNGLRHRAALPGRGQNTLPEQDAVVRLPE